MAKLMSIEHAMVKDMVVLVEMTRNGILGAWK
jgi:hypothetical protein